MKKAVLLSLFLLLLLSADTPATQAMTPSAVRACFTDHLDAVDVYMPSADKFYKVRANLQSAALRQSIVALNGRNIWVGYDHGGFDPMPDRHDLMFEVYW